jgi:hypothetical protein
MILMEVILCHLQPPWKSPPMTSLEQDEITRMPDSFIMHKMDSMSQPIPAVEDQSGRIKISDLLPCYREAQHATSTNPQNPQLHSKPTVPVANKMLLLGPVEAPPL